MATVRGSWFGCAAAVLLSGGLLAACGERTPIAGAGLSYKGVSALAETDPLATYSLSGDMSPIRDPSIIKEGLRYYLFSTDVVGVGGNPGLPIRCSNDEANWTRCGNVFAAIPAWLRAAVPGVVGLWAPDVTYWGGLYRVYYTASTLHSQRSVIGVATNAALDPADPRYVWVDGGEVLGSQVGEDFNAIDPNILLDTDGRIWLNYGSYWSGIKQIEIDAGTGKVKTGAVRHDLATRPGVVNNPIEGASMVKHNGFYYLFESVDYCCNRDASTNNYKEAVGRATSPQGPFLDADGTPMMSGGGTVILDKNAVWNAAGGGTAYIDAGTGESVLVFHAVKTAENGVYGWLKHINWQGDWPVLQ